MAERRRAAVPAVAEALPAGRVPGGFADAFCRIFHKELVNAGFIRDRAPAPRKPRLRAIAGKRPA